MDLPTALILLQDGLTNGAIYALLALSLVLTFTVTRIIFIPAGELVAFAGLAYANLSTGHVPGSLYLLLALGLAAFAIGLFQDRSTPARLRLAIETLALPAIVAALTLYAAPRHPGILPAAALAILLTAPMAPYLYRIAFQPLARASILTLLIAAVGVHLALTGLGLVFFGPEGFGAPAFSGATLTFGTQTISGQALWVFAATALLMAALALFFATTLHGRALRATAINRTGAQLCGIGPAASGRLAFTLAGLISALSGILVAPLATLYYDSGFLIGLKGFVAAIVAGLASFPGAVAAALLVGIIESFASFWASAFKEVIVFTTIIPVLLWRSLATPAEDE